MNPWYRSALAWAALSGAAFAPCAIAPVAFAQSAGVAVGPNGVVQGGVSVPGAPPVSVQAGNGQVSTSPPPAGVASPPSNYSDSYEGPGRSATVRSPDGRATSSVTVTGDNAAVSAGGSPGSQITVTPDPEPKGRDCPRGASRDYQTRTGCRPAPAQAR